MSNEYDEQFNPTPESDEEDKEYAYKNVIKDKQHRRTWSVVSLALSIISIILSMTFVTVCSWIGLVLALGSVGCAIISRKNIGYFDKLSIAGIIVAIFGVMFAITGLLFSDIISNLSGIIG